VRAVVLSCLMAGIVVAAPPPASKGDEGARQAAASFGRALTTGSASSLRTILPQKGKVRLTLALLGPEDGAFAAAQVEALFRDFLAAGKVHSFVVTRYESDGRTGALAYAKASIVDRDGQRAQIGIQLWLEPEGDRWVLREVKESAG